MLTSARPNPILPLRPLPAALHKEDAGRRTAERLRLLAVQLQPQRRMVHTGDVI